MVRKLTKEELNYLNEHRHEVRKHTKEELSEIRKNATHVCIDFARPKQKPGPKHRITISDADYQTLKILAAESRRSVPAFVHLLTEVTKAKNPQFFKK